MMKIALLTCEKLPELLPADRLLIPALAQHSIEACAAIWDDKSIDWSTFDFLIFRNTWDYFEKESEFNQWLDRIESQGIKTLNPIDVIKRNIHKFYLRDMESRGISILPTIFVDRTDQLDLESIIPKQWKKAVIKPAFSAGSYLTESFLVSDIDDVNTKYKNIASEKDMLLQQFMPQIQTLGETSFIFFNKVFSHCVNKLPADGDFRVQVQFGGKYKLVLPDSDLIAQAQRIVDLFDEPLLYARVDGIVIKNKLHLMEIECIEPDLYLDLKPEALQTFTNEIIKMTRNLTT